MSKIKLKHEGKDAVNILKNKNVIFMLLKMSKAFKSVNLLDPLKKIHAY